MRTLSKTLFLLACASGVASANAFYLNEHDAKVTGRGGTATATATDPSAIVYNPGGLAVGEGTAISIGASLIAATATYNDPNGGSTDTDGGPAVLPQAMVSHRINDMFAVGLGFHLPFGLAVSWPDSSPQSDVVTKQSLRTYFITPAVGVNLDKQVPGLSIGAGLDLVPATVLLESNLFFGAERGTATLGGTAFGIGGRAGLMYRPETLKQLSVGVSWRSQIDLDVEGTGDFDMAAPYRSQLPPDGDISTTLHLPMSVSGGVAYRPMEQLELELNAVWINWEKFDTIDITLPDGSHNVQPQDYSNTVTLRLGGEYKLPAQKLALRAGYVYDPTPVPSTTISARLPDINRHVVSAGATYKINKSFDASVALLWVTPGSNEASTKDQYMPIYKGTYDVQAFVASLGLIGRFAD
ncbi:MAG: outer membrane protein transport protein [Deltaproteobacteria bacterium]|nr:outer membrane protein transport protein [Deltaproteobacteria bacterium]